jgi:hypothetical protein
MAEKVSNKSIKKLGILQYNDRGINKIDSITIERKKNLMINQYSIILNCSPVLFKSKAP